MRWRFPDIVRRIAPRAGCCLALLVLWSGAPWVHAGPISVQDIIGGATKSISGSGTKIINSTTPPITDSLLNNSPSISVLNGANFGTFSINFAGYSSTINSGLPFSLTINTVSDGSAVFKVGVLDVTEGNGSIYISSPSIYLAATPSNPTLATELSAYANATNPGTLSITYQNASVNNTTGVVTIGSTGASVAVQLSPPTAVPEPASMVFSGTGAAMLGGYLWYRRRRGPVDLDDLLDEEDDA